MHKWILSKMCIYSNLPIYVVLQKNDHKWYYWGRLTFVQQINGRGKHKSFPFPKNFPYCFMCSITVMINSIDPCLLWQLLGEQCLLCLIFWFIFFFCGTVFTHVFLFLATSTRPTVFPLMQCGSGTGNTVTLGCFATGFTPSSLTYAWTKNGAALTNSIQYPPVQKGNVYTGISQIQVPKQDWDQRQTIQCAVTHAAGNPPAVTFQKPGEIYGDYILIPF